MITKPAYYNEIDEYAAQWLRNLIAAGLIAPGEVDTRSIKDVRPDDLRGFAQCHFFAGIGGWSAALRLAGWPDDRPVWTGSCPCQPFSAAGKGAGEEDERHLWPTWSGIIRECRPDSIFGEQVASRDGLAWLDTVSTDVEAQDYAIGTLDLCAAGVGADHIRNRLYFVAKSKDWRQQAGQRGTRGAGQARGRRADPQRRGSDDLEAFAAKLDEWLANPAVAGLGVIGGRGGAGARHARPHADQHHDGRVDDADGPRLQERTAEPEAARQGGARTVQAGAAGGALGDTGGHGVGQHAGELPAHEGQHAQRPADRDHAPEPAGAAGHQWRPCDWVHCRDGKTRPVEPGTFPLAYGLSIAVGRELSRLGRLDPRTMRRARANRVGRLRGYGNAIVPELAAEFIRAAMMEAP